VPAMRIAGTLILHHHNMPNTRQFLFRLYCKPIRSQFTRAQIYPQAWPSNELNPFGVHTIDTIVSLPPATPDLIQQANHIAQAYATLCVKTGIYWISVFELQPDVPADATTPVTLNIDLIGHTNAPLEGAHATGLLNTSAMHRNLEKGKKWTRDDREYHLAHIRQERYMCN